MRRYEDQRAYTHHPSMITEYMDKFLAPQSHSARILGSTFKNQQQLRAMRTNKEDKGTHANNGECHERSFRSNDMAQKWVNHTSKLPPVSNPNPMSPNKCCCAQFCPSCTKESNEANLTVYRRDFQEWTPSKRQPFRNYDNLKVCRGVDADLRSKERQPFEKATSYNSAYVSHPMQPRKKLQHPGFQNTNFQISFTAPSCCGHCLNGSKSTPGQRFSRPGKDDGFNTTMRVDFTEHKCPRTKPCVPLKSTRGISKEPFKGITTMKDDYRKWDLPRRPAASQGTKNEWKKDFDQVSFSRNTPGPNHCQKCHGYRANSDKGTKNGSEELVFDCGIHGVKVYVYKQDCNPDEMRREQGPNPDR